MSLTPAEIEHFREQGYVIPNYRLPDELLERLRQSLDRLLATYTDVAQEDLANPHMMPPTAGPDMNPFMEAARQPGVLDMLEQLIGPDLVLWITRVLCKPAAKGREVPWHQDGEYWLMRPLATCSAWIAHRSGEHRERLHAFHPGLAQAAGAVPPSRDDRDNLVLNLELDQDQFDEADAVNVELEPGQISLHDVRLIHGSARQHLGPAPCGAHHALHAGDLALRPLAGHARRDNSPFNIVHQPLWLMRGVDRSGKNDFVHGHAQWQERYAKGLIPVMESEG